VSALLSTRAPRSLCAAPRRAAPPRGPRVGAAVTVTKEQVGTGVTVLILGSALAVMLFAGAF
jgi:hypothetical protein